MTPGIRREKGKGGSEREEGLGDLAAQAIYEHRFSQAERNTMTKVWQVLVGDYFQRFVPETDSVILDLGAGHGHFINQIRAARRIAIDGNPSLPDFLSPGVEALVSSNLDLPGIADESLTHIFMSNFLEHLSSSREVLKLLQTLKRKLRAGGLLMILGPNYRYAGPAYFDFIDHQTVLTDKSLEEGLRSAGYEMVENLPRFLPLTSKSRFPKFPGLVRLYLRFRPAWFLLGKQMFLVGRKK